MTPEQWFPEQRDVGVDRRFHTLLQESFYHAYCELDIKISEHKMLHWVAMRVAAGGTPVLPPFERYDGLPALLNERSRYIREWVRVFYATLFIEEDRQFIDFMFQERHYRLTRARLATLLGVQIAEEPHYLHYMAYGNTVPPRRPHETLFPSDEEVSILFQQPFIPGTPRTPDRLTPVAHSIHLALRKSLLYRIGYNEGITALQ